MKNPLTKKAVQLANAIAKQYSLLTIESKDFFEQYHDIMQIQRDCAYQTVNDIEHYEIVKRDTKSIEYAKEDIEQLEKTLTYCKAVIKLQSQTNKLPEAIYG